MTGVPGAVSAAHAIAELEARPRASTGAAAPTGEVVLGGTRVYVPASYSASKPAGVLAMLHGAGGSPTDAFALVRQQADEAHVLVVAPKSQRSSWDVIGTNFGPDVASIDRALAAVFERYAIDPRRVAIGGFSDGASYALSVGLANGNLFHAILAFSPGFEVAPRRVGRPRIFISHGCDDRVLPIERTSHRLVPALTRANYRVEYFEFVGGHTVPAEVVRMSLALLPAA